MFNIYQIFEYDDSVGPQLMNFFADLYLEVCQKVKAGQISICMSLLLVIYVTKMKDLNSIIVVSFIIICPCFC